MKKIYIVAFLAIFVALPTPAHAVRIGNVMDPLCLFSWRDGCKDTVNIDNSITDSFNINSNINSPGGVVSGNTSTVVAQAPYVYTPGPTYYYEPSYPNVPPPVYNTLSVSCSPNDTSVDINDQVRWTTSVSGGNGSYSYEWSGDNISGGGSSITTRYGSTGNKYASVTVRSGNQSTTRSCGYVTVNDYYYNNNNYNYNNDNYSYNYNYNNSYNNIYVQCYPDVTRSAVGSLVTWRATVSGGNGYYEYSWSGSESIYGNNINTSYSYRNSGTKYASVTVRSGNRSVSQSCGTVVVDDNYYNNYQTNTYTGGLSVSCSASVSQTGPGKVVTWTAYPTGGNGYYTYAWTGTDGFAGSQKSVVTTYPTLGTKTATVTVYSAGQVRSQACTSIESVYSKTYTKAPVKQVTAVKPAPEAPTKDATSNVNASLFSAFAQVPWALVMIIVIFVLFGTVMYLLLSKKG